MPGADHHTAYLAQTLAALTPEGHARADELLDQLAAAAGGRERLRRFAKQRRSEVDAGHADQDAEAADALGMPELEALFGGFATLPGQEPREDVAAWANAVVQLIEDELAGGSERGRASGGR